MIRFLGQCIGIAGLYVAFMAPVLADAVDNSTPDANPPTDSTPETCKSNSPEKSNTTEIPGCIDGFFKRHSQEKGIATLDASYALGVMFQRDLAGKYEDFDYAKFLLGALEEADTTMRFSDAQLERNLKSVLLSKAEKSDKFVREFAERADANEWKGIYYIDQAKLHDPIKPLKSACGSEPVVANSHKYAVDYLKLNLTDKEIDKGAVYTCLRVNGDEVIRGWRTALRKMNEGDVWELVVPAPLAYGQNGTAKTSDTPAVEKGEALRFMIRLHSKT